jgi:hypothetical protein
VSTELLEPERAEAPVDDTDRAPDCLLCGQPLSRSHAWLCPEHQAADLAEDAARASASEAAR